MQRLSCGSICTSSHNTTQSDHCCNLLLALYICTNDPALTFLFQKGTQIFRRYIHSQCSLSKTRTHLLEIRATSAFNPLASKRPSPYTKMCIWATGFHAQLIVSKVTLIKVNSFFKCTSSRLNTLMLLQNLIQIHCLGVLGCKYILSITIINVT